MKKENLEEILQRHGVMVQNSHLVYTSGKHGSAYFNKDAIYPHTEVTHLLCLQIAGLFALQAPEVVIGPVVGGVALSQWTANALQDLIGYEVLALFADKVSENGQERLVVKRGYDKMLRGKRVLVVEDVLTTGGSVKQVVELARSHGAEVIGVGALCNRGGITAIDIGEVPMLVCLWNLNLDAWAEEDCPLCKQGVPINIELGKGREFLARKAQG